MPFPELTEKQLAALEKYKTFLISDFEGLEVCDAFLDDFEVDVSRLSDGNFCGANFYDRCWGLSWNQGAIGDLAPPHWTEEYAKMAGCLFVHLYLRHIPLPDCQTLGYAYAYMNGGKDCKVRD